MNQIFKTLLGNLVLTRGPQDLPYSSILMRLSLMVYFITGLPGLLTSVEVGPAVLAMALDTLVLMLFAYLCLQAFSKLSRYTQTVTALAATGAIFQLLVLPLLYSFQVDDASQSEMFNYSLLLLIFVSWNLAVYAHVMKESFGVRLPAAMVLTICYVIINVMARKIFFPELN